MDELEKRVIELEWNNNCQKAAVEQLRDNVAGLTSAISLIQTSLNQIKWIATGAVISFVVIELGLLDSLALFAGL